MTQSTLAERSLIDRILPHIMPLPNGCWRYDGYITVYGYGQIKDHSRNVLVHRAVYEWQVGPIPDGLTLDHLCHTRAGASCSGGATCPHRRCVNPEHLEPVTLSENRKRTAFRPSAHFMTNKTHCPQGHEYTPENTRYYGRHKWRQCRICWRSWKRDAYAKKKARERNPQLGSNSRAESSSPRSL